MHSSYGGKFLNHSPSELHAQEAEFAKKPFPGCIGLVDCMHIAWKNSSRVKRASTATRRTGKLATVAVEAMCDNDLYCWHFFVGREATATTSPLRSAALFSWTCSAANGVRNYPRALSLMDSIAIGICTSLRTASIQNGPFSRLVTKMHEGRRKYVERLFGVLQCCFRILRHEFDQRSAGGNCTDMRHPAQHAGAAKDGQRAK